MGQENHMEEMRCEQEKVTPNIAGTDGFFYLCLCVFEKKTGYLVLQVTNTATFMCSIKL